MKKIFYYALCAAAAMFALTSCGTPESDKDPEEDSPVIAVPCLVGFNVAVIGEINNAVKGLYDIEAEFIWNDEKKAIEDLTSFYYTFGRGEERKESCGLRIKVTLTEMDMPDDEKFDLKLNATVTVGAIMSVIENKSVVSFSVPVFNSTGVKFSVIKERYSEKVVEDIREFEFDEEGNITLL